MNLEDFITAARKYQDLGWAVQEQLDGLLAGDDPDDMNPDALEMIGELLADLELRYGVENPFART